MRGALLPGLLHRWSVSGPTWRPSPKTKLGISPLATAQSSVFPTSLPPPSTKASPTMILQGQHEEFVHKQPALMPLNKAGKQQNKQFTLRQSEIVHLRFCPCLFKKESYKGTRTASSYHTFLVCLGQLTSKCECDSCIA